MANVYIVFQQYVNDEPEIMGIFSSSDKAREYIGRTYSNPKWKHDCLGARRVDEDGDLIEWVYWEEYPVDVK